MGEWTKVVTNPLGLAGFALFVIFLIARRTTRMSSDPFFSYALVAMAFVALLGGIGLAYWRTIKQVPIIEQKTEGSNSPAVGSVTGDVNININRSVESEGKK